MLNVNTAKSSTPSASHCDVLLGNSNARFSGVTSTMLQTLPHQQAELNVRVLGLHHLPEAEMALSFREAIQFLRKGRADGKPIVFHARRNDEMIQALILKKCLGAKIKICFTSTAQRYHSGFSRWLMARMDGIISTCQAAANYLSAPPDVIIPHGIQTEQFFPAENRAALRAQLGLKGRVGIGIFGRVRKQKGVDIFVEACIAVLPQFPEVEATIVGAIKDEDRDFVDQLKQKINDAGLQERIIFTGERPFNELPDLFRAMNIVCALSYNEGFGLTVLEAMASRAAVVATDAGAWREIIREEQDGFVISRGDTQALKQKLTLLLKQPSLAEALAESAYQRVLEHYRVEREAHQLCEYYLRLRDTES